MSDDPAAWIFLAVWTVMWMIIMITPARVLLSTPPGRWAVRFMAGLARSFDRFFLWFAGRVLAVGRWRP